MTDVPVPFFEEIPAGTDQTQTHITKNSSCQMQLAFVYSKPEKDQSDCKLCYPDHPDPHFQLRCMLAFIYLLFLHD